MKQRAALLTCAAASSVSSPRVFF